MSDRKGTLGKGQKGRLSLSKKTKRPTLGDAAPAHDAQSIMTLFKRQKESQTDTLQIEAAEDNSDLEIIEKNSSPYFSTKVETHKRRPSRLKLKKNTSKTMDQTHNYSLKIESGKPCKVELDVSNISSEGAKHMDGFMLENTNALEMHTSDEQRICERDSNPAKRKGTSKDPPQYDHLKRTKRGPSTDGDPDNVEDVSDVTKKAQTAYVDNDVSSKVNKSRPDGIPLSVKECNKDRTQGDSTPPTSLTIGAKQQLVVGRSVTASGDGEGADVPALEEDSGGEGEEGVEYRVPYYLENFQTILNSTLEDEYYSRLFNDEDRATVALFQALSDKGQKLYVRLFQRKLRWLREGQIQYPKIAEDLNPVFNELVSAQLLMDETRLDDLSDVLHVLSAPDVRSVAKSLRLSASDQRPVLIEAVLKHARQRSIGAFFSGSSKGSTNEGSVLRRAKGLLGQCYRVETEQRWVFMRAMMLCSLHTITGDEDERGNNTQLFQMLLSNIGQVTYPVYEIRREAELFRDRADLLTFCTAVQVAADMHDAVEGNALEEAMNLYTKIKPEADALLANKVMTLRVCSLPEHLRWYTAGASYVRALTQGVEALQKTRDYLRAVHQLEELLAQHTYHTDYRGRWYERLALNLHTHLKKPAKALEVIKEALQDPAVRVGHRLAIWQRAQKMCTTPSLKKLHHHWDDFKDDHMAAIKEAPKVTIEGRQLSLPGAQSTWCTDESSDGSGHMTFIRHVEDVALRHYAQDGYPQGLHGEAGTLSALLALLLWDVLFMDVPDAFINRHQTAPLDLYTDNFYTSRQVATDSRLEWLTHASAEEIEEEFSRSWIEHENTLCVGLSWQRYEGVDHAKGLIRCIGGKMLSLIFSRMVKNLRFTRSGFPDLVVWNTQTNKLKVVEVKGPNDRLSTKQILWLNYLTDIGIDAEVCYVVAVGTKKLR